MRLQHGQGREAFLTRRLVAQRHGTGQDRVERRLVLRLVLDPFHDRRLRIGEREGDLVRGERVEDRLWPFEYCRDVSPNSCIKRGFDSGLPECRAACRLRSARLKTAAYSRSGESSAIARRA